MSLFGEKYGERVRVVARRRAARRSCAAARTCRRTGDIGAFRITLETSIAAGVRRIEAVTGLGAIAGAAARPPAGQRPRPLLQGRARRRSLERVAGAPGRARRACARPRRRRSARRASQAVERLVETAADARRAEGPDRVPARRRRQGAPRASGTGCARRASTSAVVIGEAAGKAPLLVGLSPRRRRRAGSTPGTLLEAATRGARRARRRSARHGPGAGAGRDAGRGGPRSGFGRACGAPRRPEPSASPSPLARPDA